MRSDLEKVEGVLDVTTDTDTQVCRFKLAANAKVDIKAKLDELAKTNDHIAGWQMMGGS